MCVSVVLFHRSAASRHAQVVLVGDSRAGKSSLLAAFAAESFEPVYTPTVGVDFKARTVRIDDGDGRIGTVKLTLWDSAGALTIRLRAPHARCDAGWVSKLDTAASSRRHAD